MPSPSRQSERFLLAVDTGGTFTDFFLRTPEGHQTHKVLSTPQDPSQAILQGIQELRLKNKFEVVHGSTVATNAFLERKGARVALVTTRDFEDILEIGRQNRPALYDFKTERPPLLVSARYRYGIRERVGAGGKVLTRPSPRELKNLTRVLERSPVDSIAICLLFSYANPRHELVLKRALQHLNKFISVSSEVCPEYREYERTSTTCINAYVVPVMSLYLVRLQKKLKQRTRIMQSNGGSLSLKEASREAVHTLLSGPAGGVLGAYEMARRAGITQAISLDMGGTSTDMSLMDGEIELTSEANLGGMPIKTPMIRIDTLGAGGGSLAWVDKGGALRVGPQSAGANPGPLCYGQGGNAPTITDAHVYLGRIPPEHFLGGRMKLFPKQINSPLKKLSQKLKLSMAETADGILTVANANMARALRVLSLERGYDPRDFTLLPFGGAGPLHACELALILGIPRVLVPAYPGMLSAYGMAHADWVRDYVQTVLIPEDQATMNKLNRQLLKLKKQAKGHARSEGFKSTQIKFKARLDVRYQGQSYELSVPLSKNFKQDFKRSHRQQYGFLHQHPMEIVNIRLQARVLLLSKVAGKLKTKLQKAKAETLAPVEVYWKKKTCRAKVLERKMLVPGNTLRGPAIIPEFSATTFLPPGWNLKCDRFLNLILRPSKK